MSRKFKSLLNLVTLSTDPSIGSEGDVYFNTTTKNIKIHNGTVWIALTPESNDPTPFYAHTHSYDGEVDTVFPVAFEIAELGGLGVLEADNGDIFTPLTQIPGTQDYVTLDGGVVA